MPEEPRYSPISRLGVLFHFFKTHTPLYRLPLLYPGSQQDSLTLSYIRLHFLFLQLLVTVTCLSACETLLST